LILSLILNKLGFQNKSLNLSESRTKYKIVKISKEVIIGIAFLVAIGCFIFGFNFLKGKNYFSNQRKFYAVYKDIDGLVEANPSIINGYKVGIVGAIKLSSDTSRSVIVTLLLDDEVKVPRNSIAKVVSSDILGSKAVRLELGTGTVYANDGDTLKSDQEDNLKQAVNKTIAPLQKKAEGLISSIDSVMTVIQAVFNKSAQENLSKSFENITLAIGSLQKTSYRIDTMVINEKGKISNILSKVNVLTTTLANNSDKLSNVINNFSAISDSIAKSKLTSVINNADVTLTQVSQIMNKVNKGEGSLGMLVNSDSLYRKLDKSADDLDKLLIDLRMNPHRYVQVSVFGGKDKNKPAK
jgi:phospholipid/cholesterol/gamma-HCH transport system substrate-binding protein